MLETREHTRDALIALGSAKLSYSFLNILGASLVRGYPADSVVRYIKPVALIRVTISPGELAISMSSPCLERAIVSCPILYCPCLVCRRRRSLALRRRRRRRRSLFRLDDSTFR